MSHLLMKKMFLLPEVLAAMADPIARRADSRTDAYNRPPREVAFAPALGLIFAGLTRKGVW